jgi:SET domain-containing protein
MVDVEARPSPIEGLGLFALRDFAAGETILVRREREVTAERPLRAGEREEHCDYLEGGRVVYLGSPERHLNHSCEANAYIRERAFGGHEIAARRAISTGEEITNDYSMNSSGPGTWSCACGASTCRGAIEVDFFALPLDVQAQHLPLLMTWFKREHEAEIAGVLGRLGPDDGG